MIDIQGQPPADPGFAALMACASGTFPEGEASWFAQMSDADWQRLVSLAQMHGLAPLAYYELYAVRDAVPPWVMEALKRDYDNTLAANVMLYDRAQRILTAFQQADISVLPLKGVLFAQTLYPSIGARPMCDLDLVVPFEHLEAVGTVLQGFGYRSLGHGARSREYNLRYGGEMTYGPPRSWPTVDLHWQVIFGEWVRWTTAVLDEDFWDRAEPATIDGVKVRQLTAADSVLHQVWHAAVVHGYADLGLRTLVDLDRTIRAGALDWPDFVMLARRVRLATAAYFTLDMCVYLLDTPVPAAVLDELQPPAWRRRLVGRVLDRQAILHRQPTSARNRYLLRLLLVDRLRDVARLLYRTFFPERDWLVARYEPQDRWSELVNRFRHPVRVLLLRGEI
ncbi:MAG: nucleotidyltransferase family protein [Chloroflexi bacterium]|nr:nucleotidyltransferase family protein [Chloroflexota bacterium]